MSGVHVLSQMDGPMRFPDPRQASDGLVAVGGDLRPDRLLHAYAQGIFPWFGANDPILWWSPDPRGILLPDEIHVARSLRKDVRKLKQHIRFALDQAFSAVMNECAAPRVGEPGTWITPDMKAAYMALHQAGHAHSMELWAQDELVGGLYGVALGGVFYGESMFSRIPGASRMVLVMLARQLSAWGFVLIDTQFLTPHLASMGARAIPRHVFLDILPGVLNLPGKAGPWNLELEVADVF